MSNNTGTRRTTGDRLLVGGAAVVVMLTLAFILVRFGGGRSGWPTDGLASDGYDPQSGGNQGQHVDTSARSYSPSRSGGQGVIHGNLNDLGGVRVAGRPKDDTNSSVIGEFETRFAQLADAGDWDELAQLISDGLRTADPLAEFLPILWACLETVDGRTTYDPVGRALQLGLLGRPDLPDHREALNEEFMTSESPLLITAIAGPVVSANKAAISPELKTRVERLLVHREVYLKGTGSVVVRGSFEAMLIAAHVGHSASILESIEFVQSLRATGLSLQRYVKFWELDVATALYYRRYGEGDVAAIIRHLLEFSHERLAAESGRAEGLAGLKKIWPAFREDAALAAIEAASAAATEPAVRDAWDEIAIAWLAYKK